MIIVACQPAKAQQFETAISPAFDQVIPNPLKWGADFIVMADEAASMQLAFTFKLDKVKARITLFRFDSTMNLVTKNPLFGEEKRFGPFPPQMKQLGSKYYLVYSIYSPADGLQWLLAGINPETLALDNPVQLVSQDLANSGLRKSFALLNSASLQFSESPSGNKLLVSWSNSKTRKFYLAVLDSNLRLEWKKDFESSGTGDMEEFTSCVDNKGVAYVSYMFKTGKSEWIYKVDAYSAGRRLKENEVKTRDSKVYQVVLIPSKTADLVHVVGSYSEHPGKLNGLFHQTVSIENHSLKANAQYPFTRALVEQLTADNWASTKEKTYGLNDLRMQGFGLSDGSVALVGQWGKSFQSGRNISVASGSILNARIQHGKATVASIPRYRVSAGSTIASSYKAIPFGNKLLIFYNDNEDNLQRDPLKPPVSSNVYKHASLVAAYLNDDGTIKREQVIAANDRFVAISEYTQPIAVDKLLVPIIEIKGLGGTGNESKWGTITLK